MIFVAMQLRARPGQAGALAEAMAEMQENTRGEPGSVVYSYSRDLKDPELFHLCEMWQDEETMEVHIDAPHSAAFSGRLGDLAKFESVKAFSGEVRKHRVRAPGQPRG